jgi:sulfite reductase (ferredoxin)
VPLHQPVGFLPATDLARIGELAARYSGGSGVRTTRSQNLILRFVKPEDLAALTAGLRLLETDVLSPAPLDRFVTCAGAATCRMGICLARNAARACAGALAEAGIARDTLDAMEFHLNGCTNACGQQPIAPIGFFGAAQREHEHLIPSYGITLGGRCGVTGARLGTAAGRVPARALPAFVRDLATDFESRRTDGESFHSYFDRLGPAHFQAMAARHTTLPSFTEHPESYRDVGAEEEFSLAGRGAGECGSGVFEVIQQDLMAAKKADNPFDTLLATTRALLVTRGIDARDSYAVLREFERHFIETGLVAEEFRALLTRVRGYTQGWNTAFEGQESAIARLRARVELLYSTLDANLEFHPPDSPAPEATAAGMTPGNSVTAELDLSGVPCPVNFVKARLRLQTMNTGETLALILDDGDPIRNVPASLKNEGHEVGKITNHGSGHWRVVVRKTR